MITQLNDELLDFDGQPITDEEGGKPWTVKSALLVALVHPGQPKEMVDQSVTLAATLEQCEDDVDFGPEAQDYILEICRNALPPILYMRVKAHITSIRATGETVLEQSGGMRCS